MPSKPEQPERVAAIPGMFHRFWIAVLAAPLTLVLFRIHAFGAPFEVDECNYACGARRLLAGGRLYIDFWDHQPPAMYALVTGIAAVAGTDPLVFRITSLLAALASLVVIVAITRRHLGDTAGIIAGLAFAVVSSDPGVAGEGWNRELFMNLLAVLALDRALRGGHRNYVLAGLLLGIGSLFKTVVAAQWLALAGVIVGFEAKRSPRAGMRTLLLLGGGPAMVWALTIAYFAATGRAANFIDAVFVYNLSYGQVATPLTTKLVAFFQQADFSTALPLWIGGALGLLLVTANRDRRFASMLWAYAVGSYIAVCLPGKFWHHYFMLMVPVLVLAAVAGIATLVERIGALNRRGLIASGVGLVGLLAAWQVGYYLSVPADQIAWKRYRGRMRWAREVGALVEQVTAPDDTIYFASIDVGVYYYSRRACATRYTLATFLHGDEPGVPARLAHFLEDLRRHPPRLIGLVAGMPYLQPLDRFIQERGYIPVAEAPPGLQIWVPVDQPIAEVNWAEPAAAFGPPR